ncbi:MAG: hypothetical protein LBI62_10345 [Candidatus Accumulibacter sp.]|nr:hypothetical protein [Accumulibacter sp.]
MSLASAVATAQEAEVIAEGRATLAGPEGQATAREAATRHALAQAIESYLTKIDAQSGTSACARQAELLSESTENGELVVKLKVQVDACPVSPESDEDENDTCAKTYLNRLLVTGFAFEFPEQLLEEWNGRLLPDVNLQRIETQTATELSRALERGGQVHAVFEGNLFPYASPARAPILYTPAGNSEIPLVALAQKRQAQYVLSGIYREFGLERKLPTRHRRPVEIEAFLHDGASGAVLARRTFLTEASSWAYPNTVSAFNTPAIGTRAFRETPFGQKWTALIDDIARWAGAQTSCLPFIARIVKVEGRFLQLDAGAESRINPGDALTLRILREPPVFDLSARLSGQEKQTRTSVIIRTVHPAFSIAELVEAPETLKVSPGDFVYTQ